MTATALTARPLSQVAPAPVRWLWEGYLPRGKLALLDGDPGVGKSLVALDLAARLSRGGLLPDGTAAADRPHVTLVLSGEDGAADTLRPRAGATGGDLDRVLVVESAGGPLPKFPADLPALEELVLLHAADLVVIDPVMAFLPPKVAANSDQCVRVALNALAALAERTDCTILLVRHLRKKEGGKAIHRGLASVGIIGAVRAGLLAAPHPANPEFRVLAVTKTNLAKRPPALGFRLVGDRGRGAVEWGGPLGLTADALGMPAAVPLRPRDRAADWLVRTLSRGPVAANDVLTAAAGVGIPETTLNRAKAEAAVKSQLVRLPDDRRVWYWYDPSAAWPADAPFKRPYTLPPLDPL